MYCSVLYCTVLYSVVLYCSVLHCTLLYCTVDAPHIAGHWWTHHWPMHHGTVVLCTLNERTLIRIQMNDKIKYTSDDLNIMHVLHMQIDGGLE